MTLIALRFKILEVPEKAAISVTLHERYRIFVYQRDQNPFLTGDSSVKLGRASQGRRTSPMSLVLTKTLRRQFRVLTLLVVPLPFLLLLCRAPSTSETPSTMCGGVIVMVMSCVYASQSCLGRCSLHASPEGEGGGVHFQISCHPINTSHERCHNFSKICSECLAPLGSKAASSTPCKS